MQSLASRSRLKNRTLWREVYIYTYPGGTPSVAQLGVLWLWADGAGGIPGRGGAHHGGGAPVPVVLHHVCGFFAVSFWRGRQPSIWFSRICAGCHSIAAFTFIYLRKTTPRFFFSRTSEQGFFICCCVSSVASHKNPPLAILAIFKARCMADCSSCTRPPCPAIVADMLKTYRKLVAASKVRFGYYLNHIPLPSLI